MRVLGITHAALELSSPTRMERWLRDVFGLQLLRQGYWKGEYVRVMGSPHHQRQNPGFLILYNRPFIPRGRLRHVGLAVDQPIDQAVADLRRRGYEVDGEDIVVAPFDFHLKIDSFTEPRPMPVHDPSTKMADEAVDPNLPCLWRGIHHLAPDVPEHEPLLAWLETTFGLDHRTTHDRRGEIISSVKYDDAPRDAIGRRRSLFPQFLRRGTTRVELNHIAFEVADAEGAITEVEARGPRVDLWQDAMIHGPEEVWYQIDSYDTPFPVDHPANPTGVTFIPYPPEGRDAFTRYEPRTPAKVRR
jgi:catechol 2,3-dioxygenase-like lactoylglutathione lyase family enzyme